MIPCSSSEKGGLPLKTQPSKVEFYRNLTRRTGRLRVFPGYTHAATYKTVAPRKAIAARGPVVWLQ
jgi:hypothetical protein